LDLSPVERLTLLAILRYCWSKPQCEVWAKTLVADVGTSERNLTRVLTTLEQKGWIEVDHRNRQKSVYKVLKKELIPPYPKKGK
jgi:DNA-binding MarR family transcriptional regulator